MLKIPLFAIILLGGFATVFGSQASSSKEDGFYFIDIIDFFNPENSSSGEKENSHQVPSSVSSPGSQESEESVERQFRMIRENPENGHKGHFAPHGVRIPFKGMEEEESEVKVGCHLDQVLSPRKVNDGEDQMPPQPSSPEIEETVPDDIKIIGEEPENDLKGQVAPHGIRIPLKESENEDKSVKSGELQLHQEQQI
ncbi:hypothetical protein DdX_09297 [Ditylenchus destructor]|uniref:Secreted protein n=1 Tax=Ditylenchus destructor TaxID=166010 RepID=A0AAD4N333_9BILA|nr:hypothetical protein DdX_09297 [Ditylenchus destructor]